MRPTLARTAVVLSLEATLFAAARPTFAQTAPAMPAMEASASLSNPNRKDTGGEGMTGEGMAGGGMAMSGDMAGMHGGHGAGALGAYPATRDASGTAWQPDSAPHEGLHRHAGPWSLMLHGQATLVYDNQGGPRGGDKTFVLSHLMAVASRPLAGGTLTLRALGSLDPLMGKSGYPLLLQTGETADGRTPLIDRQHPHDLFGELAAVYSRPLGRGVSAFVYGGPAGEPALGPVAYLHRFAGMADPETPIDHHWLDSTHTTYGVITTGLVAGGVKLEGSSFTGREPNQHRWDLEHPRFDSWSVRASWNPGRNWSLQVSRGRLHSVEQLSPLVDQNRTTASATYNRAWPGGNWQTVAAWGRLDMLVPGGGGHTLDAWLGESALTRGSDTVFGRFENADKDELFAPSDPRAGTIRNVSKLSLGYYRTFSLRAPLALDLGGLVSRYGLPHALNAVYGSDPTSFMLFVRVKLR